MSIIKIEVVEEMPKDARAFKYETEELIKSIKNFYGKIIKIECESPKDARRKQYRIRYHFKEIRNRIVCRGRYIYIDYRQILAPKDIPRKERG